MITERHYPNVPEPDEAPRISIVIPVYNEEGILRDAVTDLRERLAPLPFSYEIILAENGSCDRTVEIASELSNEYGNVHYLSLGEPNYGGALRSGIRLARGEFVLCDEIDLCDTDFHRRALDLLESTDLDMVIGSKRVQGARDERPFIRHAATVCYNGLLRTLLDFQGTDTHGLKAFKRLRLLGHVDACLVEKDVFASELVVRASRAGLLIREIPVRVREKRPPSINLFKRVPNVLKSVARLTWAIRVKG